MTDLFARDIYLPSLRKLSDTWAEETLQDLEDFIEEQGGISGSSRKRNLQVHIDFLF